MISALGPAIAQGFGTIHGPLPEMISAVSIVRCPKRPRNIEINSLTFALPPMEDVEKHRQPSILLLRMFLNFEVSFENTLVKKHPNISLVYE